MHTFKDAHGRSWNIVVSVGPAKNVRNRCEVDLLTMFDSGGAAQKLFSDPCLLVDVLYVLCESQCSNYTVTKDGNTRRLSDIEFGEGMVGDTLEHAANALLQEVIDFFPQSRQEIYRKMVSKSEAAAKIIHQRAMEEIDKMDFTNLSNPQTPSN